jgi:predicted MFS family arabinose efflux permease
MCRNEKLVSWRPVTSLSTVSRCPVYVISFGIYVAANTGLIIQNRYAALLLLRMLQSLGASATVAIGYGVAADIATPAERGRVQGPAMVGKYIH